MPWPNPAPRKVNVAGTGGLLGLALALGVGLELVATVAILGVFLGNAWAGADRPPFAHNEQSAIPSAMRRWGLNIIP